MKIFCDLHHIDLYHSLQILFERRLGWQLYRPIGIDWYKEDYWNVYPHINTARQYLDETVEAAPLDVHGNPVDKDHGADAFINNGCIEVENGLWEIPDNSHQRPINHKGVTLKRFKRMKFDIIVSSIPNHIPLFNKLIELYQPQAKHIFQAGSNFSWINPSFVPDVRNILTSARGVTIPEGANSVYYHQEFDLDVFCPSPPKNVRSVTNFQHVLSDQRKEEFLKVEELLPDWDFKMYGAFNRDGVCPRIKLPDRFKDTGFVWHVKECDEGYGYNIHNAFACGKPCVVNSKYQHHNDIPMTAALLYTDTTVIDYCKSHLYSPKLVADYLNAVVEHYEEMSKDVTERFNQVVNFDREFESIKDFLENLQ